MENCKIVIIGDAGVGKTCLLFSYTTGSFPHDFIPHIFDGYSKSIMVDNRPYNFGLWDTTAKEGYERFRRISYPGTNVFLVCFDVTSRTSFTNIEKIWLPEVKLYAPDVPVILVANKIDVRNNESGPHETKDVISQEEGQALAAKLDVSKYMECSALTQEGIPAIIPTAVRTAFSFSKTEKRTRLLRIYDRARKRFTRRSACLCCCKEPEA